MSERYSRLDISWLPSRISEMIWVSAECKSAGCCANEKSEHASIQQITTTAHRSNLVIIGVLSTRTLRQASSCRFGGFGRKLAFNHGYAEILASSGLESKSPC